MKPMTAEEIAAVDARFAAGENILMRCLHHEVLAEFLTEPLSNRIRYIQTEKPEHQRERRLSELQIFQQAEKLPVAFVQAWAAFVQARAAYNQARAAYDQAWAAYDQARAAYNQARAAYKSEIEALDRENYPDSKWNGKTIFS